MSYVFAFKAFFYVLLCLHHIKPEWLQIVRLKYWSSHLTASRFDSICIVQVRRQSMGNIRILAQHLAVSLFTISTQNKKYAQVSHSWFFQQNWVMSYHWHVVSASQHRCSFSLMPAVLCATSTPTPYCREAGPERSVEKVPQLWQRAPLGDKWLAEGWASWGSTSCCLAACCPPPGSHCWPCHAECFCLAQHSSSGMYTWGQSEAFQWQK